MLEELLGHLVDEPAAGVCLRVVEDAARLRVREKQALAGARDGDVRQAALLLHPVFHDGAAVGEDALLHAGDKDGVEFEPFRRVHRHERDGLVRIVAQRVKVGTQREPFHEVGQRRDVEPLRDRAVLPYDGVVFEGAEVCLNRVGLDLLERLAVGDELVRAHEVVHNAHEFSDVFRPRLGLLGVLRLER